MACIFKRIVRHTIGSRGDFLDPRRSVVFQRVTGQRRRTGFMRHVCKPLSIVIAIIRQDSRYGSRTRQQARLQSLNCFYLTVCVIGIVGDGRLDVRPGLSDVRDPIQSIESVTCRLNIRPKRLFLRRQIASVLNVSSRLTYFDKLDVAITVTSYQKFTSDEAKTESKTKNQVRPPHPPI